MANLPPTSEIKAKFRSLLVHILSFNEEPKKAIVKRLSETDRNTFDHLTQIIKHSKILMEKFIFISFTKHHSAIMLCFEKIQQYDLFQRDFSPDLRAAYDLFGYIFMSIVTQDTKGKLS